MIKQLKTNMDAIYHTRKSRLSTVQQELYSKYKITNKTGIVDCINDPCYEIPCVIISVYETRTRYSNKICLIETMSTIFSERICVDSYWLSDQED